MRRDAILQEFYNLLHMSIVQKFLTNQIVANEIIIVMTPYCPTQMQQGVNLLSLKTAMNQNALDTYLLSDALQ